jgi:hypothetical protein
LQDEARKELHSLTAGFSAEIGAIAREVHREKTNRAVREAASERATTLMGGSTSDLVEAPAPATRPGHGGRTTMAPGRTLLGAVSSC